MAAFRPVRITGRAGIGECSVGRLFECVVTSTSSRLCCGSRPRVRSMYDTPASRPTYAAHPESVHPCSDRGGATPHPKKACGLMHAIAALGTSSTPSYRLQQCTFTIPPTGTCEKGSQACRLLAFVASANRNWIYPPSGCNPRAISSLMSSAGGMRHRADGEQVDPGGGD